MKNNNWKFYQPSFAYRQDYKDEGSPWGGHVRFGYDLVSAYHPELLVELGTYKGTSMYSFLQAKKDNHLPGKYYAIDCWEGDEHSGFYGDEIYDNYIKICNKYYQGEQIENMRMYFDEALPNFKDKSIDLLHIDGLHTYEAVKHDFETWLPKLKPSAVVLFHDTNVDKFGVKKYWNELKKSKQYSMMEFKHSNGLGIMCIGDVRMKSFLIENEEWLQNYYSAHAEMDKALEANKQLEKRLADYKKEVKRLESKVRRERETFEDLLAEQKTAKERAETTLRRLTDRKSVKIINKFMNAIGRGLY